MLEWMLKNVIFDPRSRTEIIPDVSYFCFLFQSKNMIWHDMIYIMDTVKWVGDIEQFSVVFLNKVVIA